MQKFLTFTLLFAAAIFCASAFAGIDPIQEVFEPSGSFDPARYGKVAVVQWNRVEDTPLGVSDEQAEAFKMESRKQLERFIREAAGNGAEWVLTPEFSIV